MSTTTRPPTMRAIALATYCKPDQYGLADLPTPQITKPDEVLIKVHAASINPIDVKLASGLAKLLQPEPFPYKIGYDVSGTILAVGPSVTTLTPGTLVYSRIQNHYRGAVAEYALSTASTTAHKPASLSHTQAAAMPLAGLTALQSLQRADAALEGGLKGKTVLVPGALSGTGSFAVQLARNVFGAGKVVTTLSTGKVGRARELFGDVGIEYVDYTKEDVVETVGRGTVDFFFDTMGITNSYLPVMKKGGVIVSIAGLPSGTMLKERGMAQMPWVVEKLMNWASGWLTWWIERSGVSYSVIFMKPDAKGLSEMAGWVEEGKLQPVVGRTAKLEDLEAVRSGCQEVYDAKGGVGKFVVEIV